MPINADDSTLHQSVVVPGSATIELSALFCSCDSPKPQKINIPPALTARANRFWNDGYSSLAEVVVLADAVDLIEVSEIEQFLERLRSPIAFPELPGLETETVEERDVIHRRLERLASDRRLRTRYVALLTDLWSHFDGTWDSTGRTDARRAGEAWQARVDAGTSVMDLLPERHVARREPRYGAMVRQAQRDGSLRLSPTVSGHGHIVALPHSLSLCTAASGIDPVVTRRAIAAEISDRLKALADPTRLTILTQLAHAPSGVSELARTLHVSQPTASVHLRQLREAGLVHAERQGTRTVYSVRPDAVDMLLAEVGQQLTRSMSHPVPLTAP